MTTIHIDVGTNKRLEFAFGTLAQGDAAQRLAEYFAVAEPLLQEHGIHRLGSFGVLATNRPGTAPRMGALTAWPTADNRVRLHEDPRFLAALPTRDIAMEFLADGFLFETPDEVSELDSDEDYAVVIAKESMLDSPPLFELRAAEDTASQEYAGRSLSLHPWSEAADRLLESAPDGVEVFRIRFRAPSA